MATNYPGGLDSFSNPTANTPENATGYEHDLQHANANDAIEAIEGELGINPSGTYSTVAERVAALEVGGANKEVKYTPIGTPVYADEFNGSSLDAGWSRLDASGVSGHVEWTLSSGVLSAKHGTTTDSPSPQAHYMLRTLADNGGSFAAGDAIQTAYTYSIQGWAVSNIMFGCALLTGTTYGTSNAVRVETYTNTSNGSYGVFCGRKNAGLNTDTGEFDGRQVTVQGAIHVRLVMTAADTWRADYSPNGVQWWTGTPNTYALGTPTHMGIYINLWLSSTASIGSFEYFRRYSGVS